MTTIEELIAECPRYTKCGYFVQTFCVGTLETAAFETASPGDVLYLYEYRDGQRTGARVTALVLERAAEPSDGSRSDIRELSRT